VERKSLPLETGGLFVYRQGVSSYAKDHSLKKFKVEPGAWRIEHGNCLQLLHDIRVKMTDPEQRIHIITDPPYEDELHEASKKGRVKNMNQLEFDGVNDIREGAAKAMVSLATGWLLAFTLAEGVRAWRDPIQAAGGKWDTTCAWIKPDSTPRMNGQGPARGFENIVAAWCGPGYKKWNGGGKRGLYTHLCNWKGRVSAKDGGHPTEKPLSLMMELVKDFTNPGDLIIDPFCGTGTTGEAAIRQGRAFIGIDKSKQWAEWSRERLELAAAQTDMFENPEFWRQQKMAV